MVLQNYLNLTYLASAWLNALLLNANDCSLQIKMARPQINTQQAAGPQFGTARGMAGGRGAYPVRYGYGQGQYASNYGNGGYGYDASGGYGYGDYAGGYQQYGSGMQMMPMMLPSGQVQKTHCICHTCRDAARQIYCPSLLHDCYCAPSRPLLEIEAPVVVPHSLDFSSFLSLFHTFCIIVGHH